MNPTDIVTDHDYLDVHVVPGETGGECYVWIGAAGEHLDTIGMDACIVLRDALTAAIRNARRASPSQETEQ